MSPDLLYLIVVVGILFSGIVAYVLIGQRTPRGTVLIIAVGLYVLSWQINGARTREMLLLTGGIRMLGLAGIILGLFYFFRKRKPRQTGTIVPQKPGVLGGPSLTGISRPGQVSFMRRIFAYLLLAIAFFWALMAVYITFLGVRYNRRIGLTLEDAGVLIVLFAIPIVMSLVGLILLGKHRRRAK